MVRISHTFAHARCDTQANSGSHSDALKDLETGWFPNLDPKFEITLFLAESSAIDSLSVGHSRKTML